MKDPLNGALRVPFGLALLASVGWFVADFPILRLPLAAGFVIYAICLWRWPRLWLVAVPALLPLLDLAPWSGRFFFDEFDSLVLVVASYFLSAVIRLWPPPPITPDSFADYDSPYNSLRIAKGFVWAMLLFWPLRRALAQDSNAKLLLCFGFLIGLFGVGIVSVYERWLFPGVLTWNTDYRITSSFSSMHTGDGHIDVWLATTIPLLGILFIDRRWLSLIPLTIGLSFLAVYTLIVTASRGPAIAVAIAFGVGMLGLVATRAHRWRVVGAITLSLSAIILIATLGAPLLSQTFLARRFVEMGPDAVVRLNHWRDALRLRDDSITAQLFGMGLGSFPMFHQERAMAEPRAARFRYMKEGADNFLRVWSGQSLYMGQVINIMPQTDYQFTIRFRASEPSALLTVSLCEIWMLSSRRCTFETFPAHGPPNQWQTLSKNIHSDQTGSAKPLAGLLVRRPTWLTFFTGAAPLRGIDVDSMSLKDAQGRELIRNGDFSLGADHWFWMVDDHLPWHTKNLVVNVLFDQGWFGLLAVGCTLGLALIILVRQIAGGDSLSAVLLAAMTGFIVTGITVSTFDQPRLALMFYLLCFLILCEWKKAPQIGRMAGSL